MQRYNYKICKLSLWYFLSIFLVSIIFSNKIYANSEEALIDHIKTAIIKGDLAKVTQILQLPDFDVNMQNKHGFTALMLAVIYNKLDTIKELAKFSNIDVNLQNNYGYTALMYAANQNQIAIIKELINLFPSIDINLKTKEGFTATKFAIYQDRKLEVIKKLAEFPNLNIEDYMLLQAILCEGEISSIKNKGAFPDDYSSDLFFAIQENNLEYTREIITLPYFNVNRICNRILIYNCCDSHHIDGNVLMVAAYCGCTEIIKELADLFPEIDVNIRGEGGKSALHYAVLGKAPQAVKELVTLFPNIDVNMRDDKEFTPLHTAIGATPTVIRELANIASCDVNAKNKIGDTALIIAAKYGYIEEIIELAKIPNINPKLENNNGDTAIDIAQTELTRRCLIKLFPYFKK